MSLWYPTYPDNKIIIANFKFRTKLEALQFSVRPKIWLLNLKKQPREPGRIVGGRAGKSESESGQTITPWYKLQKMSWIQTFFEKYFQRLS